LSIAPALAVIIASACPLSSWAAESTVTTPEGRPIVWSDWLRDNAPVAVLFWASWVPDAARSLDDLATITAAARAHDLDLVLVVVQEPLDDALEHLSGIEVRWFHDRYGQLLKDNRVVSIPRILVIAEDGRVIEEIEVKPAALRTWGGG
jgi:thiol-disulfide isomerase/thioredoxin